MWGVNTMHQNITKRTTHIFVNGSLEVCLDHIKSTCTPYTGALALLLAYRAYAHLLLNSPSGEKYGITINNILSRLKGHGMLDSVLPSRIANSLTNGYPLPQEVAEDVFYSMSNYVTDPVRLASVSTVEDFAQKLVGIMAGAKPEDFSTPEAVPAMLCALVYTDSSNPEQYLSTAVNYAVTAAVLPPYDFRDTFVSMWKAYLTAALVFPQFAAWWDADAAYKAYKEKDKS